MPARPATYTLVIRLLTLIFLLILTVSAWSQNPRQQKIDKIKLMLAEQDIKPIKRISGQLKLVSHYVYSHPDVDSLIEASLKLAEEKQLKFFIARSLKFRARYNLFLGSEDEVIEKDLDRIEAIGKTINNKFIPLWIAVLRGEYLVRKGELELAKPYIDSLEVYHERTGFKDKSTVLVYKGIYYQQKRDYERAIASYEQALTYPKVAKSFVFNHMAELYLELEDYDKAASLIDSALVLSDKLDIAITRIQGYDLRGGLALAIGDTTSAILDYRKAEDLRSLPYLTKNHTSLDVIVDLERNQEKKTELLANIGAYRKTPQYPTLLIQQGEVAFALGDFEEAKSACKDGLDFANRRSNPAQSLRACECLVQVSLEQGDLRVAISLQKQKEDYQTILSDQKQIKGLAKGLAQFESKKEKTLLKEVYQKDQLILGERMKRYMWAGALALLLLLLSLYFLQKLKGQNGQIKRQNDLISKALAEKEVLLREIHHRVKNNLQLVSSILTMQGRSIDDSIAQQAIEEGKRRVRSMALIHQGLYTKDSVTDINVKEYIDKLVSELFETYAISQDSIELETDIDEMDLDIDTMVPLGLIINELITNALKYAFIDGRAGHLFVSLKQSAAQVSLVVKDNGIGYDPEDVASDSFGSTLIEALTAQLEGEKTVDNDKGTVVEIRFPI